ncbi:hypothetical protein ACFE04_005614 [Oxalis oulophora]
MVFSSVPVYLDPPNWQQQASHHHHHQNHPHQLLPLPPHEPPHVGGSTESAGGGSNSGGSIRPGSMSDRARLAKMPQPEVALKCPRCESTNTKFCYFNNYSLSQPRHFCKTCRRYWTKGGALRSVPVGGGCRRNKKIKTNHTSSKSSPDRQIMGSSTTTTTNVINSDNIINQYPQQAPPQFPFLGSLHNLTQYGLGNLGLNFSGLNNQAHQIGGTSSSQVQQFPFLESPTTNLFPFQSHHEGIDQGSSSSAIGESHQLFRSMNARASNLNLNSQLGQVKREGNYPGGSNLSSSRISFMGVPENNNNQFWGGNNWSDLSNINNSSTTTNHIL